MSNTPCYWVDQCYGCVKPELKHKIGDLLQSLDKFGMSSNRSATSDLLVAWLNLRAKRLWLTILIGHVKFASRYILTRSVSSVPCFRLFNTCLNRCPPMDSNDMYDWSWRKDRCCCSCCRSHSNGSRKSYPNIGPIYQYINLRVFDFEHLMVG